jgi:adenylate kinase
VTAQTELGVRPKKYMDAGDLVPDEVTIAMVRERLAEPDADAGFLLDGFPRTVPQAEALGKILDELQHPLTAVLELTVDDDEVVGRLSGRRTCRSCGHVWHVEFEPPAVPGICDDCGGELFQRDDDQPETIRRRLEVYAEQTAPLVRYYSSRAAGQHPSVGGGRGRYRARHRGVALRAPGRLVTPRFRERGIELKTRDQLAAMRQAGLVVGETLELLADAVAPGITTGELDALAEQHIRASGAVPSFLGTTASPPRSAPR